MKECWAPRSEPGHPLRLDESASSNSSPRDAPPKSVDRDALKSACSHETAPSESHVILYEDEGGRAQRIAVSPDTVRLADHGSAVFDGNGKYLAEEPTTGGEVVDDSVVRAQQVARDKLIPPSLKPHEVGKCGDY